MPKCFVFAIGGTGSRVLSSMTYLLAAGAFLPKLKDWEIVPIIVDMDTQNGNMVSASKLLRRYSELKSELQKADKREGHFFGYRLNDLYNGFKLTIQEKHRENLAETIKYETLEPTTQQFLDLLYRTTADKNPQKDQLYMNLDVGFKGAPNIGSVVLNQIPTNASFQEFAKRFTPGDRIVIIGSLFGGTGAAGLPLLAKTFRAADKLDGISNGAELARAPLAAIMVMPYFSIKQDQESAINSDTFISKTRAALRYYEKQKEYNSIYYLADRAERTLENKEGGSEQKNEAHYAELVGAKAIFHFLEQSSEQWDMQNETGNRNPVAHEYGMREEYGLNFKMFDPKYLESIVKPLVRWYYSALYIRESLKSASKQAYFKKQDLDSSIIGSTFVTNLTGFCENFFQWLNELQLNDPRFRPLDPNPSNLREAVIEMEIPKGGIFGTSFKSIDDLTPLLNGLNKLEGNPNARLLDLLYRAADKLIEEKKHIKL
jgi:hypothetical protein